jgi:transcription antitermination factor NusA-like protein
MSTIHEQLDELLAADLHDELTAAERDEFHAHLVECAECRQAFQEGKTMNRILNETLAEKKAGPAFEQRMVSRFRDRVPKRTGLIGLIVDLMRMRAVQLTAAAAVLLALAQMGKMITGESMTPKTRHENTVALEEYRRDQDKPGMTRENGVLAKTEGRTKTVQIAATPAPPPSLDAVASTAPNPQSQALRAPTKTKKTEFKDEKAPVTESESAAAEATPAAVGPTANRKLIRNATAELEVVSFDESVQKITAFAAEEKGYVSTTSSEKQANGKLRGQIVVKVLPDNLDRFLGKLRGVGELKNQALTTEDVTKAYFDTESRLKNARLMEQRLIEILKTKSKDVADLLEVEKELGRVREEIETMQGELKFMDSQVAFATVTITLAEKNMNVPAAFLLKEHAQLSLYATEVEKTYNDIKALASPKVQITNAQIDRDNTGRVSARLTLLLAPEESEAVIAKIKEMARVENFQVTTERVSQGGDGLGETAKTERDKVELNITLSRDEQEIALQLTSLRIQTPEVNDKTKQLRAIAEQQGGRIRSSSFSRDPNGREYSTVSLRVPMKNYNALMQSLNGLGKVENVSVRRDDRPNAQVDEANAPADVSIQVYSQGNIVSEETGIWATLRRTIGQGAAALMWSVRMIGVAIAFLAPWALIIGAVGWIARRVSRARTARKGAAEQESGQS